MDIRDLFGITKTSKSYNDYWSKNWLNKSKDLWVYEFNKAPLAVFDNRWDARRALNKKLSYEIKNWGMEHVRKWVYKVEKLKYGN